MPSQAPPENQDQVDELCEVWAKSSDARYRVRVPRSDVDAHIKFSWFRCLFSVFGYLLVLSDIPRTGYGIRVMKNSLLQVSPGTVMEFGPYAYPIVRIQRNEDESTSNGSAPSVVTTYNASSGASEITGAAIWPYKYDSLSIALRGLAMQLGVLEYPRCLLYIGECSSQVVSLEVTFKMLDALVSELYRECSERYHQQKDQATYPPYVFRTRSYWIDRLHHYIFSKFNWHRIDTRLHAAHYYHRGGAQSPLRLCNPEVVGVYQPSFCDEEIAWEFAAGSSQVVLTKVSEHIAQRLSDLERQHPHLQFDVAILTTQRTDTNIRVLRRFPVVYYKTVQTEIISIIRGRLCTSSSNATCVTSLIDDFRYERGVLTSDVEDWYNITRALRAASQLYVWLRIACLFVGCYWARRSERKFATASVFQQMHWILLTIFKIPSHVIIYGSWVPIVLYVVAHFIDCGLVHLLCELVWASLNGSVHFEFLKYVQVASVQMRNVWLLALMVKSLITLEVCCLPPRRSPWLLRHGLTGIRGGVIGLLSFFTIFSYLRFIKFRRLPIIEVRELSIEFFQLERTLDNELDRMSEFGFYFDLRTIGFVAAGAASAAAVLKLYLVWFRWWFRRRQTYCSGANEAASSELWTRVFFLRMYYIPYSVGTLAPRTALSIFWRITVMRPQYMQQSARRQTALLRSNKVAAVEAAVQEAGAETTRPPHEASEHTNKSRLGAVRQPSNFLVMHESMDVKSIFKVEKRSGETWSVVQLINIALLTEPLALLSLFVTGQDLYLYQVNAHRQRVSDTTVNPRRNLVLLPCDPEMLARNASDCESLDATSVYELMDIVNSKSVPWRLLVFCG